MITALIPVRNEPQLASLVLSVRPYVDRIVVMDDTAHFDPLPGVIHRQGVGSLGGSLLAGMRSFRGSERLVVIDAGGSHDPDEIPYLLQRPEDVVIGSRFCPGGVHEGPSWRKTASRLYGMLWGLTGYPVKDWTSGFRAYSTRALRLINSMEIRAQRHAFQAELLIHCLRDGLSYSEVPITYRVQPGSTFGTRAAVEAVKTLAWSCRST